MAAAFFMHFLWWTKMQMVSRQEYAPASLTGEKAQRWRVEFYDYLKLASTERVQTRPPKFELDNDVSRELSVAFLGKCAFCDRKVPTSAYRFRPADNAEPLAKHDGHIHYSWLSDAWQNLFPICVECTPSLLFAFPLEDGERAKIPSVEEYERYMDSGTAIWPDFPPPESAVLLDPCHDTDISSHIFPNLDGFLSVLTKRGEATVKQFNLNRVALRSSRKEAFRKYSRATTELSETEDFFALWQILRQSSLRQSVDITKNEKGFKSSSTKKSSVPEPRIEGFQIWNFKSLERLNYNFKTPPDSYAQSLIIIGENAAGKSSILEAITLNLMEKSRRKGVITRPSSLRLDPKMMGASGERQKASSGITLFFENGTRRQMEVYADEYRDTGSASVPRVFAYGAYRHFVDDIVSREPIRAVINLFHSNKLISSPEKWLMELAPDRFNEVVRTLRVIFGTAEKFNVMERDENSCYVVTNIDSDVSFKIALPQVSSGFRTILALACDVMRWCMSDLNFNSIPAAKGVLLIDEVEAHLHPRWKLHIMSGLRQAFPNMTIVATTHDPLCLRGMREGEVIVLNRVRCDDGAGSLPLKVEAVTDLPSFVNLTIEQLLTSDIFSLFSTDDQATEAEIARLADYLANARSGTIEPHESIRLRSQITAALPIGMGEATRIVQEALALYLVERRSLTDAKRKQRRKEVVSTVYAALKDLDAEN